MANTNDGNMAIKLKVGLVEESHGLLKAMESTYYSLDGSIWGCEFEKINEIPLNFTWFYLFLLKKSYFVPLKLLRSLFH